MSMQDKDMDELFRSKLENLEVEPSDRVWKGIVLELDGNKKRRTLLPVIRIAASITVVLGIGLFFLMKENKPDNNQAQVIHPKNGEEQPLKLPVTETPKVASVQATSPAQNGAKTTETLETSVDNKLNSHAGNTNSISGINITSKVAAIIRKGKVKHSLVEQGQQPDAGRETQQAVLEPQQTLAAITNTHVDIAQPVVPDQQLNMPSKNTTIEDNGFTPPVKVVTAELQEPKTAPKPTAKKHGIRSFGDLINVVVAKVDKRQDKLIEFSNTDDDEATITGINLGIVKVKKDK